MTAKSVMQKLNGYEADALVVTCHCTETIPVAGGLAPPVSQQSSVVSEKCHSCAPDAVIGAQKLSDAVVKMMRVSVPVGNAEMLKLTPVTLADAAS